MSRGLVLLLCLAPQFLVVAGVAAREEVGLRTGVEVRLRVGAVDPMNPFSGRYVSIPLAIALLDPARTRIEPGLESGAPVCVRLERDEPFWKAVAATRAPPTETGAVFLSGTWKGQNRVDYGLDTFFIPDNGADPSHLSWERGAGPAPLVVIVRVARNGRGRIEDLLVQGRPYAQWNAAQKPR